MGLCPTVGGIAKTSDKPVGQVPGPHRWRQGDLRLCITANVRWCPLDSEDHADSLWRMSPVTELEGITEVTGCHSLVSLLKFYLSKQNV